MTRDELDPQAVLSGQAELQGWQEDLYKTLHRHPELGHQETQTATTVATALNDFGYEVHEKIGSTGVVGILANGDGPVVLMRADMDALPVARRPGSSTRAQTGPPIPTATACRLNRRLGDPSAGVRSAGEVR